MCLLKAHIHITEGWGHSEWHIDWEAAVLKASGFKDDKTRAANASAAGTLEAQLSKVKDPTWRRSSRRPMRWSSVLSLVMHFQPSELENPGTRASLWRGGGSEPRYGEALQSRSELWKCSTIIMNARQWLSLRKRAPRPPIADIDPLTARAISTALGHKKAMRACP